MYKIKFAGLNVQENNAMSLLKILIVSPLYMIMTVLTMVYAAVAIASDCAKFTPEGPH